MELGFYFESLGKDYTSTDEDKKILRNMFEEVAGENSQNFDKSQFISFV